MDLNEIVTHATETIGSITGLLSLLWLLFNHLHSRKNKKISDESKEFNSKIRTKIEYSLDKFSETIEYLNVLRHSYNFDQIKEELPKFQDIRVMQAKRKLDRSLNSLAMHNSKMSENCIAKSEEIWDSILGSLNLCYESEEIDALSENLMKCIERIESLITFINGEIDKEVRKLIGKM